MPLDMKMIPLAARFRTFGWLVAALLLASCGTAKWSAKAPDTDQMLADITYLASDKLEGRTFGSEGEKKAGDYIAARFKKLGLKPAGENGTWFQTVTVKGNNPHGADFGKPGETGSKSGRNVIGYMDQGAKYTVIIGAHYDHLGYGQIGSLYMGEPAVHNGADDNASGVAMMMELAQRLRPYREHNYLFLAFTGEENGLWGSNYYCDHPTIDLATVTAMVNFDMVGRLKEGKLAVNGTGTSPEWPGLLSSNNIFDFSITQSESGIGPSDHTSFYLEDLPVIHFFTGAHEDYHKPSDDAHLINKEGMGMIADMVTRIVRQIGNDGREKMAFTKTKDPDPSSTPRMEVTLGVLPDYLYDGEGMRIDGVREGKPAELAGMKKGDIIITLGGKPIKDIYAYMEILGSFHKGDETSVVVRRDGADLTLKVKF